MDIRKHVETIKGISRAFVTDPKTTLTLIGILISPSTEYTSTPVMIPSAHHKAFTIPDSPIQNKIMKGLYSPHILQAMTQNNELKEENTNKHTYPEAYAEYIQMLPPEVKDCLSELSPTQWKLAESIAQHTQDITDEHIDQEENNQYEDIFHIASDTLLPLLQVAGLSEASSPEEIIAFADTIDPTVLKDLEPHLAPIIEKAQKIFEQVQAQCSEIYKENNGQFNEQEVQVLKAGLDMQNVDWMHILGTLLIIILILIVGNKGDKGINTLHNNRSKLQYALIGLVGLISVLLYFYKDPNIRQIVDPTIQGIKDLPVAGVVAEEVQQTGAETVGLGKEIGNKMFDYINNNAPNIKFLITAFIVFAILGSLTKYVRTKAGYTKRYHKLISTLSLFLFTAVVNQNTSGINTYINKFRQGEEAGKTNEDTHPIRNTHENDLPLHEQASVKGDKEQQIQESIGNKVRIDVSSLPTLIEKKTRYSICRYFQTLDESTARNVLGPHEYILYQYITTSNIKAEELEASYGFPPKGFFLNTSEKIKKKETIIISNPSLLPVSTRYNLVSQMLGVDEEQAQYYLTVDEYNLWSRIKQEGELGKSINDIASNLKHQTPNSVMGPIIITSFIQPIQEPREATTNERVGEKEHTMTYGIYKNTDTYNTCKKMIDQDRATESIVLHNLKDKKQETYTFTIIQSVKEKGRVPMGTYNKKVNIQVTKKGKNLGIITIYLVTEETYLGMGNDKVRIVEGNYIGEDHTMIVYGE